MVPSAPLISDVLNSYMCHVVRVFHPEPAVLHEQMETAIRNFVLVNLLRENKSKGIKHELLAEIKPPLGNCLTFYEGFVMKHDESYKKAVSYSSEKREKETET